MIQSRIPHASHSSTWSPVESTSPHAASPGGGGGGPGVTVQRQEEKDGLIQQVGEKPLSTINPGGFE